jgi:tetratricopeptide (TPR) repeat protein
MIRSMPPREHYHRLRQLIAEGTSLAYAHKWADANHVFLDVKETAERFDDIDALAWAEQYLGRIQRDQDNHDAAMRHYNRALELAQLLSETRLEAVVLDQIGTSYRNREEYNRAIEYYNRALATHPCAESFAKGNLAVLKQEMRNIDDSNRLLDESRNAYQKEPSPYGPALIHVKRARGALLECDLTTAATEAQQAFHIGSSVGHEDALVEAREIISEICAAFADDSTTVQHIKAVLAIPFRPGTEELERTLWINACVVLGERGMLREAAGLYWTLFKRACDQSDRATLKFLRYRRFRKQPAQLLEAQLLDELRSVGTGRDPVSAAELTSALARCVGAQGRIRNAIDYARNSQEMCSTSIHPTESAECKILLQELTSYR